ncbi:hypothetical protein BDC45DRAFT_214773 [Circinella umbellata]|nr:hypothetical protein BDC45DRAFT_214773 [Circinella umbellata]
MDTPSATGFLGSSIPHLPLSFQQVTATKTVLIPVTNCKSSQTFRMLRQYGKWSAGRNWSFVSSHYATKGFYPVTALNYNNHTYYKTRATTFSYSLVSFILQCISKATVRKEDMLAIRHRVFQNKAIKKVLNEFPFIVASFIDLDKRLSSASASTSASTSASGTTLQNITNIVPKVDNTPSTSAHSQVPSSVPPVKLVSKYMVNISVESNY